MQPDYIKRIDELKDEMTEDLCTLIECQSVAGEPSEGAPFGAGPAQALDRMMEIGRREGFSCRSPEGMYGILDFGPDDAEEMLGILCHLDVVPQGRGWTRPPFEPAVEDGMIFGRGSQDDKGPAVAAFYALKALKDCGYVPKKKVRMIFGLNEETGEESIQYYRERERMPEFSLVPDADFPVVNGEMGIMVFDLVRAFEKSDAKGVRLTELRGGSAPNMVPDHAEAVIEAGSEKEDILDNLRIFVSMTGSDISITENLGKIRISAEGVSAHGAMPWKGTNAISLLMQALEEITFADENLNKVISFYNDCIGFELHGEGLGADLSDEVSGQLILNAGMVKADEAEFRLTLNVRVPVSMTDEDVYAAMGTELRDAGLTAEGGMYQKPLYVEEDDPRIVKMMEIYRKYTGDMESEALVIGGGTYARQFDSAVAFGAMYPGDPDVMHGADEYIRVDRMLQTARIYAETFMAFAF